MDKPLMPRQQETGVAKTISTEQVNPVTRIESIQTTDPERKPDTNTATQVAQASVSVAATPINTETLTNISQATSNVAQFVDPSEATQFIIQAARASTTPDFNALQTRYNVFLGEH